MIDDGSNVLAFQFKESVVVHALAAVLPDMPTVGRDGSKNKAGVLP